MFGLCLGNESGSVGVNTGPRRNSNLIQKIMESSPN